MGTRWEDVHDALAALASGLPGWSGVKVYAGPQVTGEAPADYLTVGYVMDEVGSGSFTHERFAGSGFDVEETGTVRCELVVTSGGTGITALRRRAFTLLEALDEAVRDDQSLGGVLSPGSTATVTVDVISTQTQAGAGVRTPFSVDYFTRL